VAVIARTREASSAAPSTIGTQPHSAAMLLVSAFFANLNFWRHLRFSPEALQKVVGKRQSYPTGSR